MNEAKRKTGKSFLVTIPRKGDELIIQGDKKEIKEFIRIMKDRGLKIGKIEIHPCI